MNTLNRLKFAALCIDQLAANGVSVDEVTDRREMSRVIEAVGKPYVTPMLSLFRNAFTDDGFWLVGYKDGSPVFAGGARSERLSGRPAADYLEHLISAAYGEAWTGSASLIPEVSARLTGSLAYFGDLFVSPKFRGNRSNLRYFTGLGHALVQEKWHPDHTYCFVRERDAMRGAHLMYGFTDVIQRPVTWIDPPAPRSDTECIAYLSRTNFAGLIRSIEAISESE